MDWEDFVSNKWLSYPTAAICFIAAFVLWLQPLRVAENVRARAEIASIDSKAALRMSEKLWDNVSDKKIINRQISEVRVDTVFILNMAKKNEQRLGIDILTISWVDHDIRPDFTCEHITAFVKVTDLLNGNSADIILTKENETDQIYYPTIPDHSYASGAEEIEIDHEVLYRRLHQAFLIDSKKPLQGFEIYSPSLYNAVFGE